MKPYFFSHVGCTPCRIVIENQGEPGGPHALGVRAINGGASEALTKLLAAVSGAEAARLQYEANRELDRLCGVVPLKPPLKPVSGEPA